MLLYLLLASGDMFLQKLVHVMPTFADKKRAVEISREIQENISNYLFSVSAINITLGAVASGGLYFLGVSNAGMWGMLVALLNFVPYFGPVSGMALLASVGLLTFETLWQAALPPLAARGRRQRKKHARLLRPGKAGRQNHPGRCG